MKKRVVPVKNIDSIVVDIRKPDFDYRRSVKLTKLNLAHIPQRIPTRSGFRKKVFWGATVAVAVVIVLASSLAVFNLEQVKAIFVEKGEGLAHNFVTSLEALKGLRPDEARPALEENAEELSNLNAILERPYNQVLLSVVGNIVPAFKEAGSFLHQIGALNFNFLKLSESLDDLHVNGFYYFQNDGQTLIDRLVSVRTLIQEVITQVESVRNTTARLRNISGFFDSADKQISDQYLKYSSDLHNLDRFLGGLLAILDTPGEKHILLLFQNPSEIRPAGGFVGSYGDVTVREGQMINLEVQDIYWPDHKQNFDLKIVPPEPLQAVTKDWGARDANWFFDFPTSARTVMSFLESSKIYKEPGVIFEGVIALNINMIETVLGIIGPVTIEEYDLVVDQDNFLMEIQHEVEAGRDKKPGSNPKRVLGVLTPLILEKLNQIDEKEQRFLIDQLKQHFAKKDIMIFSRNSDMVTFLDTLGIDGAVYSLPNSFWGSYLAVVNANIAGGKSDAFVRQSIEARVDVDTDGGIFTDLTVTRTHEGDTQEDPWWRQKNQNFIQIFTNPDTSLVSLKGNTVKKFLRPDYEEYTVNVDLAKIEETKILLNEYDAWSMEVHGKRVFATWFTTPAGKTRTLNLRYQTPGGNQARVSSGKRFRFIFERQSGVGGSLKLILGAPLGYVWTESNSPIFVYEDDDPDARVILDLTLRK